MSDHPTGGIWARIRHWSRVISGLRISIHASSASFFLALSVFPALLLLLSLLRYTSLELRDLLNAVEGFLPEALMPYAEDLVRSIYENASAGVVSVSAITALWSASRGVQGLMTGLRAVYGTAPSRGYLLQRLRSLSYTLAFLGVPPDPDRIYTAKLRYAHRPAPAKLTVTGDTAVLTFDEPQRAPTPGQFAVVYDGDTVVCAGVIA